MAVIGELKAVLSAETAKYERAMKGAARETKRAQREIQRQTRKIERQAAQTRRQIGMMFSGAALGAGYAAFRGIMRAASAAMDALSASVQNFASFDQAMTQSVAIMGDVSDTMKDDMAAVAREMSKELGIAAEDMGQSYFFLASAGLDAAQSMGALPLVATFAKAGMFDLARATDLLTDAQSALGMSSDDTATHMEGMARVSDVLVKANTLANASVEQFSTALTSKAGAALKMFGKDVEEGVAVLAAFADQGVKGELAGNSLSITIRNLTTAAVKNEEAFDRLGVRVFDDAGKMRHFADIIEDLENALAGQSDEMKKATLLQLGFADKAQASLMALLGTSDAIREYDAALRDAGGTTQEVADKQMESFAEQMNVLKAELTDISIDIGTALIPSLREMATAFKSDVLPGLKDFSVWLADNAKFLGEFTKEFIRNTGILKDFAAEYAAVVTLGIFSRQQDENVDPRVAAQTAKVALAQLSAAMNEAREAVRGLNEESDKEAPSAREAAAAEVARAAALKETAAAAKQAAEWIEQISLNAPEFSGMGRGGYNIPTGTADPGAATPGLVVTQEQINAAIEQGRKEIEDADDATRDWNKTFKDFARDVLKISDIFGELSGLLSTLGADDLAGVAGNLSSIAEGAAGIGTAFATFATDPLGAIRSGISGLAGIATGVAGFLASPEEEVNDLRDAFLEAQGGWQVFQQDLAGASDEDLLAAIFNAETVDEYNAAVLAATNALGEHQAQQELMLTAQNALQEAIDRYGFTIDQLGPAMQQQMLNEQAMQLFQDFQLLIASGMDMETVLGGMGDQLNQYVADSLAAGQSIPASMQPMIEAMIEAGLLLDENGEAFGSAEEAGITFAQTLEEGLGDAVDAIMALVAALTGIDPVNIPVNVNYSYNDPGAPGPGGGPPGGGRGGGPPGLATGTVTTGPELAVIGERAPEIVAPVASLFSHIVDAIDYRLANQGSGISDTLANQGVQMGALAGVPSSGGGSASLIAGLREELRQDREQMSWRMTKTIRDALIQAQ